MKIEKINIENLKDFTFLVLQLWEDGNFDEEYSEYQKLIDSEKDHLILAKFESQYVGFAHASIRNEYVESADNLPIAYLEGININPEFQKKGIAKILVQDIETWAKFKNLKQIASDTDITNTPSIDFHQRIGFEEVERIVCFIKNF